MYRNIRRAMAVMFGLALSAAITAQVSAQEDVMQDVTQDEPMASVADSYGKGCCDTGCCGGSFYGDFQYVNLDTYGTEESFDNGLDSEDGYRLVGGYQGCDGLGIRARWFRFDGAQALAGNGGDLDGLDLEYFDLEITECFSLCNLHGLISAGYRHAEYDAFTEDAPGDPDESFDGDGVTLGITVQRDIGCNLGLFAWAQHSMLYGDDNGGNDVDDTLMGWTEVQLGAQYTTCVGGYNAVVRGGVEAQRHEGMFDNDTQDTGLLGWFLSAGVGF